MMPTELEHRGGVAWRNVRVGELQGWVADLALVPARLEAGLSPSRSAVRNEQGVSQVQAVTANAGPVAAPLARLRVMQARLALRASPDINAPAVARLRDGDVIEALPQPPSGYWVAVRSDGKRGWVPAQWLTPVP